MKKLIISIIISTVMISGSMADSVCPIPADIKIEKIGHHKYAHVSNATGVPFKQEFNFESKKTPVGAFLSAAFYTPGTLHWGQLACNYENTTLWLQKPLNATPDLKTGNKWFYVGNNYYQCNSVGPNQCSFTIG
jgi:hypothetical protein